MIWLLLFILALLFLLFWLPIELEVDTWQQRFEVRWVGILRFRLLPESERLRWFFRLFFWEKELFLEKGISKKKQVEKAAGKPKKETRKTNQRLSLKKGLALFRKLLGAFRLKRCRIDWDTGDFVRNAWLYPAFQMASRGQRQLSINFMGKQNVAILLQTRLGLMAGAALRALFILKR